MKVVDVSHVGDTRWSTRWSPYMMNWSVVLETSWVFYMLLPLFCLEMEEILDVFVLKMLALILKAVDHSHVKTHLIILRVTTIGQDTITKWTHFLSHHCTLYILLTPTGTTTTFYFTRTIFAKKMDLKNILIINKLILYP